MSESIIPHPSDGKELLPDPIPLELRWATRHKRAFGCTVEECRRKPLEVMVRLRAGEASDG
jgi:hypothetical protein